MKPENEPSEGQMTEMKPKIIAHSLSEYKRLQCQGVDVELPERLKERVDTKKDQDPMKKFDLEKWAHSRAEERAYYDETDLKQTLLEGFYKARSLILEEAKLLSTKPSPTSSTQFSPYINICDLERIITT